MQRLIHLTSRALMPAACLQTTQQSVSRHRCFPGSSTHDCPRCGGREQRAESRDTHARTHLCDSLRMHLVPRRRHFALPAVPKHHLRVAPRRQQMPCAAAASAERPQLLPLPLVLLHLCVPSCPASQFPRQPCERLPRARRSRVRLCHGFPPQLSATPAPPLTYS